MPLHPVQASAPVPQANALRRSSAPVGWGGPWPLGADLEAAAHPDTVIFNFGYDMLVHGATANQVEQSCQRLAKALGLRGQMLATTAHLTMHFEGGVATPSHFARSGNAARHVARLDHLSHLERQVTAGRLDTTGLANQLAARSNPHPLAVRLAMYPISSAAMGFVLGGSWPEAAVAGAAGVLSAGIASVPQLGPMAPAFAACLSFQLAMLVHRGLPSLDTTTAAMAGVYLFLPGLTATLGVVEICQKHLQAGSARIGEAGATWAKMAVGALVAGLLWHQAPSSSTNVGTTPVWQHVAWWPSMLAAGIATGVSMQARIKSLPWVAASCLVGAAAWTLGTSQSSDPVGSLLLGATVKVLGRAYASVAHGGDWPLVYPALQLMVPGSSGLRGIVQVFDGNYQAAADSIRQAGLRGICLSMGVLTGHLAYTAGADAWGRVSGWAHRGAAALPRVANALVQAARTRLTH